MNGVIYYNSGHKCLARLAVGLYSLKQHYDGDVTLVTDDTVSCGLLSAIGQELGAKVLLTDFGTPEGAKTALLNKTRMNEVTPYETTVFMDADTLVRGDITPLFAMAETNEFVVPQFHDWKTKGKIGKRIKSWEPLYPELMDGAMAFGPAINCGVYAWTRASALMREWFRYCEPGRDLHRIPDETCLQVILPLFPHIVASNDYNASCRYGDPYRDSARIIHYHGNKHCRMNDGRFVNASDLWYAEYNTIKDFPCISEVVRYDRMLTKYHSVGVKKLNDC